MEPKYLAFLSSSSKVIGSIESYKIHEGMLETQSFKSPFPQVEATPMKLTKNLTWICDPRKMRMEKVTENKLSQMVVKKPLDPNNPWKNVFFLNHQNMGYN